MPVNARRFLTVTGGEMRLTSQDVYVSKGVVDGSGGRHIPPSDLGVIRWVKAGPVFLEDQEAYDAIKPGEQGFKSKSSSMETAQIVPEELCKIAYIGKNKVDEKEEEDVSSPDSVAPAAFGVEIERGEARQRIDEMLIGTLNRACSFDDLEAIIDRECGHKGMSPCIEEIDSMYTEPCSNVIGDEYCEEGEMLFSVCMNKAIEECIERRQVCEADGSDYYKTDRLFELQRIGPTRHSSVSWAHKSRRMDCLQSPKCS